MSDEADAVAEATEHFEEALAAAEAMAGAPNAVALRDTHPNLYKGITTFALISIGLGLNFLLITPTFNQYGLSKIMAVIYIVVGVAELVLLNVARNLQWLRLTMAVSVSSFFFYAGALTTFYFQTHKTSLQLPITYYGLSVLLFALLIEPPSNPVNKKNGNGNGRRAR